MTRLSHRSRGNRIAARARREPDAERNSVVITPGKTVKLLISTSSGTPVAVIHFDRWPDGVPRARLWRCSGTVFDYTGL